MTWTTRPRSDRSGLAAMVAGAGHPIVFLHGVGLRSEAWNPVFDALSKSYQVTALDMLGHGETPTAATPPHLHDYADAIVASLDEPALIVGHSMGAVLAVHLADRYADMVSGVAAFNGIFERDAKAQAAIDARAAELDGISATQTAVTLARWFGDDQHPEREACDLWLRSVDPAGYSAAYRAFAASNGPSRAALTALTCPALFMTGGREPNSTPAMSHAMADLAPMGRASVVEEAAHMLPMTHPTETVNAIRALAREIWP